ncbi:bifunctional folylpolyglutamate synthase/dihydrofolate synthase [Leptolyngbya ohadii]|uniref:bifunctional folylpolyglutamate synthase/dihydrofolate synthase n=1 Tax=Leptolyngbya ohadii TaxID=1962290 RepID=UPI001CEE03F2|nr:folylpolyglutamate synthase/dihydrofolate synthase family protein [Leptolyngbya ohadii]
MLKKRLPLPARFDMSSFSSLPPAESAAIDPVLTEPALLEVEALLQQFEHFGVELGLERIECLLANLGNPERKVPIVHVAGSNGKGSVCAYLSSVLHEAGYRVGRYTSPHLVNWCERISISGEAIAPIELLETLRQVVEAIRADQPCPTQFEVITAAAWLYFAQQQVDLAVIEVGLGGRLDATNVCDRPLVSVITSLSLEHWQRLGPTLGHIAFEKAGILKPHCPAVIAPQPEEAAIVLRQRLQKLDCPAVWVNPAIEVVSPSGNDVQQGRWAEWQGHSLGNSEDNSEENSRENLQEDSVNRSLNEHTNDLSDRSPFQLESMQYPLPLLGAHQLINSALAIATLQILQQQGWQISREQIVAGMGKTTWQGRLQWIDWQGQPLLVDGAHNPAGAMMLRQYIDSSSPVSKPVAWVMGMISGKDHGDVFKALLRPGDRLYLVPVPNSTPVSLSQLSQLAWEVCPELKDCQMHADMVAGLHAAQLESTQSTIILCGSLYLIGHFFSLLAQVNSTD